MKLLFFRLLVCLLLADPLAACCQDQPVTYPAPLDSTKFTRFRYWGAGLNFPVLRDQSFSTLRYEGAGLGIQFQTFRVKPNILKQVVGRVSVATLLNTSQTNLVYLVQLGVDYHYMRKVAAFRNERLRFFAGGGASMFLNMKLSLLNVNNQVSYDYATTLKAVGHAQYDFGIGRRKFQLREQISIPFVALLARPPFSWPAPFDAYEEGGSWTKAFRVVSFGNFIHLQNQLALDLYPREKRLRNARHHIVSHWRLTYDWEYLQINRPNKNQLGISSILLGRVIRF